MLTVILIVQTSADTLPSIARVLLAALTAGVLIVAITFVISKPGRDR